MNRWLTAFVIGAFVAGAGTYVFFHKEERALYGEMQQLERRVQQVTHYLLGYEKYSDYLSAGARKLGEQSKLVTATVNRPEQHIQHYERDLVLFKSTATVAVSYTAEYAFGYDMRPDTYSVTKEDEGIVIRLNRPILLATPSFKNARHEVLESGLAVNEERMVNVIYENLATTLTARGKAMAAEPEIAALCERRLVAFLRDFLAKQPGVLSVPGITVAYNDQRAQGIDAQ